MQKSDINRQIFLQLCGERDRKLLMETEKMSLEDFDRLTYITDFLGFTDYNLVLWEQVSPQFKEQFDYLIKLMKDNDVVGWPYETESECNLYDMWLMDFLKNIPDKETKQRWTEIMKELYKQQGWEFPEQDNMP